MNENYIAVDIGASSGRLMLAEKNFQDKITLNEVHRFKNGFSDSEGTDHWNADHLVEEILIGLEKVKQRGSKNVMSESILGAWIIVCWMKRGKH